jgi:hypothetical protein
MKAIPATPKFNIGEVVKYKDSRIKASRVCEVYNCHLVDLHFNGCATANHI